ncbi:MAG TPA: hypothetical protein ENL35_03000, partial [Chloroflexi bacterium]|nr:hypothetical protein [Chloroflexota bacterium]
MCAETLPGPSRRLRALFGAISVRIARSRFDPNPWAELALIFGWAIWVGRAYLNFDTRLWPHGADFPLGIEPLSIWITLTECGSCILWNGFINGGAPSFADLYAPILHPLAVIATLVWGVISGAKVTLIASLAMAGMAQWWIARTLGLGRVARLWSAAMAVAGGHLAGRMEMGMAAVVLSTAACSLALAGGLQLALRGGRAATVIFGVTLASSFLAGQGYLQLGFVLAIGPSFLVFLLDRKLRPQAKAKEFVMAAILATLLSGLLLIPVVHFLPHLGKEIDTGLRGTQPLGYEPLNLVIGDFQFYQNESLGKVVLPSVYMNYIGWIPVLLAALAFWLIPRERWRVLLFFGLAFVLLLCFTSTEFKHAMARWLPEIASMLRYPSLAAGLHIPILLGLASMGLDHLLGLNRPMIVLELDATSRYHVRLSSLLLAPALVWALMSVYSFGQSWLGTVEVASDVQELGRSIPAPGSAWVQPPRNTHVWPVPLIEQGFKVAGVFRPWHWKYRDLPSGSYQAILEGEEEPEGELVAQVEGVRVYQLPEVHYAFVEANSGKIYPCIAQAMGGKIDVSCNVPEPGRLIIQENTWTGWFAYLDGTRTPLQGDQWLEVAAPDGHHTFAFRYRPWDVALGAALTLMGILLCIHHLRHGRRHTQRIPQSEIGRP